MPACTRDRHEWAARERSSCCGPLFSLPSIEGSIKRPTLRTSASADRTGPWPPRSPANRATLARLCGSSTRPFLLHTGCEPNRAKHPSGSSTMPTAHAPWWPRHPEEHWYRASSKSLLTVQWLPIAWRQSRVGSRRRRHAFDTQAPPLFPGTRRDSATRVVLANCVPDPSNTFGTNPIARRQFVRSRRSSRVNSFTRQRLAALQALGLSPPSPAHNQNRL